MLKSLQQENVVTLRSIIRKKAFNIQRFGKVKHLPMGNFNIFFLVHWPKKIIDDRPTVIFFQNRVTANKQSVKAVPIDKQRADHWHIDQRKETDARIPERNVVGVNNWNINPAGKLLLKVRNITLEQGLMLFCWPSTWFWKKIQSVCQQ